MRSDVVTAPTRPVSLHTSLVSDVGTRERKWDHISLCIACSVPVLQFPSHELDHHCGPRGSVEADASLGISGSLAVRPRPLHDSFQLLPLSLSQVVAVGVGLAGVHECIGRSP